MNPDHYKLIDDNNPTKGISSIKPESKLHDNTIRDKSDLFKHSERYGGDDNETIYLEPAEVLIYKSQKHSPNTYLPLQEIAVEYGSERKHLGYKFSDKAEKYFTEKMHGTAEEALYLALKDSIIRRRSEKRQKEEEEETSIAIDAIQNYFIQQIENLETSEHEVPEAISILRRTALAMYKSLRYPPVKKFQGGEKVVITGIGRERILQSDRVLSSITNDTATWDGKLKPIDDEVLKAEANEAIEDKPKRQMAKAFSIHSWNTIQNPFNKHLRGLEYFNDEIVESSGTPFGGIELIQTLKEKFHDPIWLPGILKSLNPRTKEQDEIKANMIKRHPKANLPKNKETKPNESYYMEYLPEKVFEGSPEDNARDVLQIVNIINQMKSGNFAFLDIKPNNFGKRKNGEICIFDLESMSEYSNWNHKINGINLEDINTSITTFFSSPELFALNFTSNTEVDRIRIDLEKSMVYSLGAMLFVSQYRNQPIPDIGYAYKYQNGQLQIEPKDSFTINDDLNINLRMLDDMPESKYKDLMYRSLALSQDERPTLEEFLDELENLTL